MPELARAGTDAPVFNVCTGRSTTIRDLAAAVAGVLGIAPEIAYGPPRAGEIRTSLGDPSAARRELGFAAETELRDGLARTLAAAGG